MRAASLALAAVLLLSCSTDEARKPAGSPAPSPAVPAAAAAAAPVDSTARAGDATLHIRSVGGVPGSPALVVVAGGWGVSHEYLRGLDALATPALRVVYFDHRGLGRSTAGAGAITFERLVEDVEAVRAALGLDRIHVLGHSAGGLTALGYALAHADRVDTLLLIDGISPARKGLSDGLQRFNQRIEALAKQGVIRPDQSGDGTAYLTSVLPVYFVDTAHPGGRSLGGATFRPEVFDAVDTSLGDFDFSRGAAALKMPVFVFAAETPFGAMGRLILDVLPPDRVSKLVVTDCGHLPWIECPDRFFPAVSAFLAPR